MEFLITILMIFYKMFQDCCKHVINDECMVQLVSFYLGVRGWGGGENFYADI